MKILGIEIKKYVKPEPINQQYELVFKDGFKMTVSERTYSRAIALGAWMRAAYEGAEKHTQLTVVSGNKVKT